MSTRRASPQRMSRPRGGGGLWLALALALALALRLYPAVRTWMPFQMVTWAQLHDVAVLASHPTARIYSDPRFDGYNNLWPGSILVVDIQGLLAGWRGPTAWYLVGPLLEALALVPFYALAKRLAGGRGAAAAALALAAAPTMVAMGGGLTKEGAARPLFYTLLLASTLGARWAAALAGAVVPVFHHATTGAALVVLLLAYPMAWGLRVSAPTRAQAPPWPAVAALAASATAYSLTIGRAWWEQGLGAIDAAALAFYILAFASIPLVAIPLRGEGPPWAALALEALIAGLILAASRFGVAPGIQPLGLDLLVYSAPYTLLPLIAWSSLRRAEYLEPRVYPLALSWAYGLLGVGAYLALAGVPLGGSAAGRILNMALPGFLLLAAASAPWVAWGEAALSVLAGLVLVHRLLACADVVNFNLVYHHWDAAALAFASGHPGPLYGDAKVQYLASYMGVHVSMVGPTGSWHGLAILYQGNLRWGFRFNSNLLVGDPRLIRASMLTGDLLYNTGHSWLLSGAGGG